MAKKYNIRKKTKTAKWRIEGVGHSEKVHLRSVDKKIIDRMPSSTDTFVEHNAINSLVERMRLFIRTGN